MSPQDPPQPPTLKADLVFLAKLLGLSLGLSLAIKSLGPFLLDWGNSNIFSLVIVFLPSLVLALLLLGRGPSQG